MHVQVKVCFQHSPLLVYIHTYACAFAIGTMCSHIYIYAVYMSIGKLVKYSCKKQGVGVTCCMSHRQHYEAMVTIWITLRSLKCNAEICNEWNYRIM